LQWLQPTPEISFPVALYLPASWRRVSMDVEAMSCASHDAPSTWCEALSDTSTSLSVSQEPCWKNVDMDHAITTESAPSLLASPLPPPVCSPSETSPWAAQTPSPTYAHAHNKCLQSSFHVEERAPCIGQVAPCSQPLVLPTLLGAIGSFAALGAWSASCDSKWADLDEPSAAYMTEPTTLLGASFVSYPEQASYPKQASAGSVQHGSGKCKPCAFVHRPIGCAAGSACSFCHLCEPDEKKLRKKQKAENIKQRRQRRVATGAAAAAEAGAASATDVSPIVVCSVAVGDDMLSR